MVRKYTNSNINKLSEIIERTFSQNYLQQKIDENRKIKEEMRQKYDMNLIPYNNNNSNIIG
jgi:hypothetical protein